MEEKKFSLLEKAAKILEIVTENIELDNYDSMHVTPNSKKLVWKNEELHEFCSLVYRLLHAGLCERDLNSCKHPEWAAEVEKLYEQYCGNVTDSKN